MEKSRLTYIRIREGSLLARFAAWKLGASQAALVVGHTIHLWNTSARDFLKNKNWVLHEVMHVMQYRRHGLLGFLTRYLHDAVKNGYHQNRFECEARANEQNEQLLNGVVFTM